MTKAIALDTWAGRRYYEVEVIGETAKKLRVKVLNHEGVMLPGRRYIPAGGIALVPRHAVVDMPEEKQEDGYYDGCISGHSDPEDKMNVDARP